MQDKIFSGFLLGYEGLYRQSSVSFFLSTSHSVPQEQGGQVRSVTYLHFQLTVLHD